jgi:endo-1,4-beta-xylanase
MVADKYQHDNLDFVDLAEAAGLTDDEFNNGRFDIETMHFNVPVEATGSHDLDKAKAAADEAKKDAAKIDAESYTAKSVKAVADAQAALDAALKTDDAAKIEEATRALDFAVKQAEKKTKSQIAIQDTVLTYTGKAVEMPTPIVLGSTGEVTFKFYDANKAELAKAPVNAGKYYVVAVVAADDNYTAAESHIAKLTVKKAANTMTAKANTVKASASSKTKIKAKKAFTVKNNKGKVTYKKMSGNSKIKVSNKGKVTVKKGLKKGNTYKVKVKVTAAGNSNYLAKTKYVYLKVKVVK